MWNRKALESYKEIIVCEALLDAMSFWAAGYRNVTASYGIEGFTEEMLEAFKLHGIERVLIAYDRDEAGERAAEALARRLQAEGIGCFRIHFPWGMDANSYALKVQPATKSLGVLIRSALWMGNGQAPALSTQAARATKEEKLSAFLPARPEAEGRPAGTELGPIEASDANGRERRERPSTPEAASQLSSLAAEAAAGRTPQASPLPPAPCPLPEAEQLDGQVHLQIEDRLYRVRGLEKNLSLGHLKVNLLCRRGEEVHIDTLNLAVARQRKSFAKQAAALLGVQEEALLKDLGKLLLKLEELQEKQIQEALAPKVETVTLSERDKEQALELLHDPNLLQRLLRDLGTCGLVGETTNKLVAYLAAVSRKLDDPLAVIVQSTSAAGKSALMDAVLAFMPKEEQVRYSAMTGQSLFYMSEQGLEHKILAIAEEEGAKRASYALKLLQSEGELSIAATGKDPATGKMITHEYRVQGPVMLFLTTTSIEIDEELQNRCIILTVDESREQTQAIHRLQRELETLKGMFAREERARLRKLHQNAQRLLRPLWVINPYAEELRFLDAQTRTRRDHTKYLTLIRSIALLHQYQRPVLRLAYQGQSFETIEARMEDIEVANQLASEALGRSLDELPPQTRQLLLFIEEMVLEGCSRLDVERQDYRFSRRTVREFTGWGNTQLKHHLDRLVEMEYLLVHRGRRGQSYVYELLYDGQGKDGRPFLVGLLSVADLRQKVQGPLHRAKFSGSEGKFSGLERELSGSFRSQNGGISGGFRVGGKPDRKGDSGDFSVIPLQNAHQGEQKEKPSARRSRGNESESLGEERA